MVKKYAYTWVLREKYLVTHFENFCITKHLEKIKTCLF